MMHVESIGEGNNIHQCRKATVACLSLDSRQMETKADSPWRAEWRYSSPAPRISPGVTWVKWKMAVMTEW